MRIGPGILPPVPGPRRPPAAEDGVGAPAGLEGRAARFTEFGMFGDPEPGAAPRPGGRRPSAGHSTSPPVLGPARIENPSKVAAAVADRVAPDRPRPAAETPAAAAHRTRQVRQPVAEVVAAAEGPAAEAPLDPVPEVESPARAPRPAPVRTATATASSLSLALREENGMVSIVAGGGAIDPDTRMLLRRLAEAMLARSGLALSHFQYNGAPVAPAPIARRGN